MTNDALSHLKEKAIDEGKRFFWIFLYLWVLLALFAVHKSLVLNAPHPLYHQGFAIINALVLGKIIFIAEAFNVAEDLSDKPLIYPIIYKSLVFSLILMSFHALEDVLVGLIHHQSFAECIDVLKAGGIQTVVQGLIMFVVLMPFFALREIGRDIGEDKVFEQFFQRRNQYVPRQP